MEEFWEELRIFAYKNRTIFELGFVFLYSLEQFGLVWFTFNIKNPEQLVFVVSIFAIIVLTTFSIHKIIMESRIKVLETHLNNVLEKQKFLTTVNRNIAEEFRKIKQSQSEDLNIKDTQNRYERTNDKKR